MLKYFVPLVFSFSANAEPPTTNPPPRPDTIFCDGFEGCTPADPAPVADTAPELNDETKGETDE